MLLCPRRLVGLRRMARSLDKLTRHISREYVGSRRAVSVGKSPCVFQKLTETLVTISYDTQLIAEQSECNTPARTSASEVALLTGEQSSAPSLPSGSGVANEPPLIAGAGELRSASSEGWASEGAQRTAQRRRSRSATSGACVSDDPLLTARQSAVELNISLPAFWKGVSTGRLPTPVYVLPRAPRWRRSELRAASEGRRMLPAEAKARRKHHRIAI